MPVFKYKARGKRGDAIEGTLEAASTDIVAARLVEGGLIPVDIRLLTDRITLGSNLNDLFMPKVTAIDLVQFCRQMHSMLRAGIPMFSAISGLAATSSNRTMALTLGKIAHSLESGRSLSDSLGQHPNIFSVFYISLIRVGETSGHLDDIFRQLAFYLDREKMTRDKIKAALRYPLFVISAIAVALVVISIWVIPAFSGAFASFGAELPVPTRILMAVSGFMVAHWLLLLVALFCALAALGWYLDTEAGRYRWDKLKLRLPLAGNVIYRATLARFSHLFAMSLHASVPLITALSLVARALNNAYLEERILGMRENIEQGKALSLTAANSGIFDPLVLQMLTVGEESGTISDLLEAVAAYYDQEVEFAINKLSSSIEPVLTLVIAVLVLVMALGVFLPMWDLASVTLGHG